MQGYDSMHYAPTCNVKSAYSSSSKLSLRYVFLPDQYDQSYHLLTICTTVPLSEQLF